MCRPTMRLRAADRESRCTVLSDHRLASSMSSHAVARAIHCVALYSQSTLVPRCVEGTRICGECGVCRVHCASLALSFSLAVAAR